MGSICSSAACGAGILKARQQLLEAGAQMLMLVGRPELLAAMIRILVDGEARRERRDLDGITARAQPPSPELQRTLRSDTEADEMDHARPGATPSGARELKPGENRSR